MTLPTLNKVIIKCTVHYILHLQSTFSRVCMKVSDSDVLAWVWGQRKMSQVLGAFGLLDFTMLRPILAWYTFWNLWIIYFFNFTIFFSGRGKPRIQEHDCTVKFNFMSWNSSKNKISTADQYTIRLLQKVSITKVIILSYKILKMKHM
jgi:hypothetical protein